MSIASVGFKTGQNFAFGHCFSQVKSFTTKFTGSHTFDLPEVFGIFRLSNAVQLLGTTRMSRALDIDMERSGISQGLPI